jgi:ATP-dependent RNA helicase SUPV3L1/SUV3
LKNGGLGIDGLGEIMRLAASGRTSVAIDPAFARRLYPTVGYKICGTRAVRIDILERLADMIRPLLAWRPSAEQPDPPPGAISGYGFTTTVAMTSLLGCAGEDFAGVLKALGYRVERRPAPAVPAPASPAEPAAAEPAPTDATTGEPATAADEATQHAEPATTEAQAVATEAQPAATTAAEPVPDPAVPAAAAEPAFIEVWRPAGRRDRGDHRTGGRCAAPVGHPGRRGANRPVRRQRQAPSRTPLRRTSQRPQNPPRRRTLPAGASAATASGTSGAATMTASGDADGRAENAASAARATTATTGSAAAITVRAGRTTAGRSARTGANRCASPPSRRKATSAAGSIPTRHSPRSPP